jgi:2-desacetyl-2-hydroxyethyl bacteriochlorophyllide A dehydrogenase
MRALTFQAPGQVALRDVPEPELQGPDDALVKVSAAGVCGSDLHIYHGRVWVDPGFVIGHELVGTVSAVGESVRRVAVGDRVVACFHSACGRCFYCLHGEYQRCEHGRTFGHGSALGNLPGAQAEQVLVPYADMTLRVLPEGMAEEVALFAGDVMGTAYHAVATAQVQAGESVAVLGLGPVGLCAVQVARAAGASAIYAVDSVPARLAMAERFGASALDLGMGDALKESVRKATGGRGVDVVIEAVGSASALELALFLARPGGRVAVIGVYAERAEVHLGLAWIKGLTVHMGLANVISHCDRVLALMAAGVLDPSPLVTHRMALAEGPSAYELFDAREALKVILKP